MKSVIILVLSLSFVLVCATVSLGTTQWAVLVGIDKYQRGDISPLRGAANDAKSLSDMFKKDLHFPERNVLVYTSESPEAYQPTTGNIVRGLKYIADKARPEDTFIMFFAGHGVMPGGESYLLTYQSDLGAVEHTALRVSELIQLIKGIKARQQLLLLDACRNDPETGRGDAPNRLKKEFARSISIKPVSKGKTISSEVSAILFSCEEGERAYEWPEKNRGFFSYFLEKGIQGEAADATGKVTLSSLVSFLQREVPDSVQKNISVDKRQVPWVRMEGGDPGSWVINRLRGEKLEELKTKAGEKKKELDRLARLEEENKAANLKEQAEISSYETKLREMDRQIEDMKKRLGTPATKGGDSLDAMVAMVRQKEAEEKRLQELKRAREQEEARRLAEIEALRQEKRKKAVADLEEDIRKYKEIVNSPYGKGMEEAAWRTLALKYGDAAEGVSAGNTNELLHNLKYGRKKVIGKDGRFIAYDNGTVLDTRTNLMWAAKDNGSHINWADAKSYCENYRAAGYTDWRMPTQDELAGLYDIGKSLKATQREYYVHLTELIQLSACCPWASEIRGSAAAYFSFDIGTRYWNPQSSDVDYRALLVRSAN